jgi:spermidine/putrescine transport system ATP-binding protein/putrescine transport system ATP-binding protein
MAREIIGLHGVSKRFGSTMAIDKLSLSLRENEFFALLGPSGCGKTTLLRMIAGFETPDTGTILLDGDDMTRVPPNHRPVNMMFQSFALFPHLTVRDNVAYGLRMEGVRGKALRQRVDEALERVRIADLAKRKPGQLSGGQQQRTALARSLIKQPKVLLLDEPLGALDRKLRGQMQLELKQLQHDVGITFLVVTHDQEEALVMADRVALLDEGRVRQVGTPADLYERPDSRFVADFIGTMNFIEARVVGPDTLEIPGIGEIPAVCVGHDEGAAVTLTVRPERIDLIVGDHPPGEDLAAFQGIVQSIAYFGQDIAVHIAVDGLDQPLIARLTGAHPMVGRFRQGATLYCAWHPLHARMLEN